MTIEPRQRELPSALSRRSFLKAVARTAAGAGVVSATGGLYAFWLEPQLISVESIEVRLQRLPAAFDGFRLAQLSDLHYDTTPADTITSAIDAANRLDADLILLTGDYVSRARKDIEVVAAEVGRLRSRYGVVGVLGNHDHWVSSGATRALLEAAGASILVNQAQAIEREGARLWLIGVDSMWEKRTDLERALRGAPIDEAKMLLVHEPDFADAAKKHSIDFQLSGHTHGGQVRLPFVGAPFLPKYGRKYPIGLRRAGPLQVYTSRGVGMVRPAVRFNCRPEVTLVTLRSEA